MTDVLSSRHSRNPSSEAECSTIPDTDCYEPVRHPFSPFHMTSPVLFSPLVNLSCTRNCDNAMQTRQTRPDETRNRWGEEIPVLAIVFEALRRSGLSCQGSQDDIKMDIGRPTNVRHVTHVTFDRFNGFLGLPDEFQMEVPRRAPSASVSVFGVSAESMQCSYDRKGNSVPTILLLLQERLYAQGGLQAEGVFRINAENSQEEYVRSQLNRGIVPHDIDIHCLAGMIKAWFRELPQGVLDSLSPEQVMQCNNEDQAVALVKTLPPMQGALLDWGVNLMADVVQEEQYNKMNAHNIAMVFAPNMTQMSDPLTALMHAVQVMNLLKMLILRTLRDRQEAVLDPKPVSSCTDPPSGNGQNHAMRPAPQVLPFSRDGSDDGCRLFLKKSTLGQFKDGYESSSRTSDERLAKYEHDFSSDRQGSSSNASSSMENTDDESVELASHSDLTSAKSDLSSLFRGVGGLKLEGNDNFIRYGKLEAMLVSNDGKIKGSVIGKPDQHLPVGW